MLSVSSGFTIIELLIAVTISVLLLAVAAPVYTSYVERARISQSMADLGGLDLRIERFVTNSFRPPNDLGELGGGLPVDPWGRPYRYLRIGGAPPGVLANVRKDGKLNPINSDYDLYSLGPDGRSSPPLVAQDSRDDVVRGGNGGFIGPAADF